MTECKKTECYNTFELLNGAIMDFKRFESTFTKLYGKDLDSQYQRYQKLEDAYKARFNSDGTHLRYFTSPGRSEIGGNHTDHNLGKVLAASIQLDCIGAVEQTENTVTIFDLTYNEDYSINVNDTARVANETGSIALVRGILDGFKKFGYKVGGFNSCFTSSVIAAAGVSSSASFEMMICAILNILYNESKIPLSKLVAIGQYAENVYWDKASGQLDQTACAHGGMICIDFENASEPDTRSVNFDFSAQGYTMMLVVTGKGHADLSAEYSSIPTEMKQIASFFGKDTLRGLTFEDIANNLFELRAKFGDRPVMRAFHFFEENDRVEQEIASLEQNNFDRFLELVKESGNSSWKWLQNICVPSNPKEQPMAICLALTEHFINLHKKGACRLHGGGFAGVIQAFIPNELADEYCTYMNKALNEAGVEKDNIYRMTIRPLGTIEITE